uniref:GDSL-type esterase/lipase family protein n=1 Tax=Roseburia sp. TaxID=2049040 RepID=UPI003FEEDD12
MKRFLRCRITVVVFLGWIVLSVIGYLGRDNIYKNYTIDIKKTPYFVLVFQGIHDGIYPWSAEPKDFWEKWNEQQGGTEPGSEMVAETEETQATEEITEAEETGATEEAGATEESGATERVDESVDDTESVGETEKPEMKSFVDVDESYFEDAVFIGDSRTVGLQDYSGLNATFYATVGLNVYDMWDEDFCNLNGSKVSLEQALSVKQYKKVYFQIGINEMGRGTIDTFMEAYQKSVEKFMELQPDAIIYVQAIMKVTKSKSDNDPIFNNEGITARNERIAELADGQKIFYIDENEVVCDESGGLNPELTFDNLHLYGSQYGIWVDFLKTKGIKMD